MKMLKYPNRRVALTNGKNYRQTPADIKADPRSRSPITFRPRRPVCENIVQATAPVSTTKRTARSILVVNSQPVRRASPDRRGQHHRSKRACGDDGAVTCARVS
jgi:hypothetical protein